MGRISLLALTIPVLLAAQAALGQNCLINYKFDQSGSTKSITDSSGASRTGTVVSGGTNGAWWSSTYKFGGHSLRFGSALGYATYATIPDISGTLYGFTIATWVYLGSTADLQQIFACSGWDLHDVQIVLRDDGTTSHRRFQLSINGCDPADQYTDYISIPASTWYHVVFTYDSLAKVARFYGNKTLLKTFNYTTATPPAFVGGMTLGDRNGTDRQYTGQLDEFRIYDAPISQACIAAIYANHAVQSIKGVVTSGGNVVAGASVSWSLTAGQALSNPTGTVWTDSSGAYSILVPRNSGPYYIAASAPGYGSSSEYSPAPSVTNADVTGIYLTLAQSGSIVDAKRIGDWKDVALANKPLYFKGDGFGYIEEGNRTAGIRVQGTMTADENGLATLTGVMRTTPGGERYIELTAISSVSSKNTAPFGANQRAVKDRMMDGLKVTIWGKVKIGSLAAHSYVISDGYDGAGVLVKTASTPTVSEGSVVAVTGAAGCENGRVVYAH